MEKKFKIVTIALFLIILFGVGITTLLNGGKKYSEFEKKDLAEFPETNMKTIAKAEFQDGLNDFLNDHMYFRDQSVTVSTVIEKMMGRSSKVVGKDKVYYGKDNYLFDQNDQHDKKQVKKNVKYLADFANLLSKSGIVDKNHLKVVMIPDKANVLSDKLPKYAPESKDGWEMKAQLWDKLDDKYSLIDLTNTLKSKNGEYIYYKTDHHWTSLGAKYGYEKVIQSLGEKSVDAKKSTVVTSDFLGSTYNKIHYAPEKDKICKYDILTAEKCKCRYNISGEIEERDTIYYDKALKKEDKYEYFMDGNPGQIDIHTGCKNGKTLVLVKDSFSNCMIPFLTSNYENIVMIDLRATNEKVANILTNVVGEYNQIDAFIIMFNEDKFMSDDHLDMFM